MAKIQLRDEIQSITGKIDGWVYRNINGQVVAHAYQAPRLNQTSAAQLERRERFRAAQAYAAEILSHPLRRAVHQKLALERKCPVNALLISNFLTPPQIERVELGGYSGKAGQVIEMVVTDPIAVSEVTVTIRTTAEAIREQGPAANEHGVWTYRTTTESNPTASEWEIEIKARNRAGAEGRKVVRPRTEDTLVGRALHENWAPACVRWLPGHSLGGGSTKPSGNIS